MRPIAWFVIGALVVACLGGPISGAISGLFTSRVAGGSTESAAVARIDAAIYIRHHVEGDIPASTDRPLGSTCEQSVERHGFDNKAGHIDLDAIDLREAILREQARRNLNVSDLVGRMALENLSDTALGALKGCIARSLLAPLCEARVHQITHAARQRASAEISRREADNNKEMDDVWCLANRAFTDHP